MGFREDIKIIWSYLKKYKKIVYATFFLAIIFAFFDASVPYIYGRLVDTVSTGTISSLILALLGMWVLTSFLSDFFKRFVSLKGDFMAIDVSNDFICDISSHVMDLPLSFHREKKVGELVSRITRAGEAFHSIVADTIFWVAPRFLTVIIGLIVLLFINWQLSLGALIVFFLSAATAIIRSPMLMKTQRVLNKKFDKSAGILNDSLFNIQTIKSSGVEDFQRSKIEESYRKGITPAYQKVSRGWANTDFYQDAIFSLGFVVIFGYAVLLLGKGDISQGTLVMFLGYLNLIRMPLRLILWQWLTVQRGMTSIKRARKLLNFQKEDYNRKGKIVEDTKGSVEYRNINFSYKERGGVLKDISFKVLPGQKIALVGGSGEGKTTTVDLLSLYFIPSSGKILLDGVDIKELQLDFLRSIIAYVPQEIVLFNDTIKNNILYGNPDATEEEIFQAARAANIHYFVESLPKKYNTLVGERGIKLSAGQKQRLAIARAIIRDPKILVLDEATSSLDVQSEKLIQEALGHLIKDKTTFIIAHRLSTVREADKILVIEKGRIVEQGSHQELMKKRGLYYKLYRIQFSQKDIFS